MGRRSLGGGTGVQDEGRGNPGGRRGAPEGGRRSLGGGGERRGLGGGRGVP